MDKEYENIREILEEAEKNIKVANSYMTLTYIVSILNILILVIANADKIIEFLFK